MKLILHQFLRRTKISSTWKRPLVCCFCHVLSRPIQLIIPGHFSCVLTCMCVLMHVGHKEKTRCMGMGSVMDRALTKIPAVLFTSLAYLQTTAEMYICTFIIQTRCIAEKIRSYRDWREESYDLLNEQNQIRFWLFSLKMSK